MSWQKSTFSPYYLSFAKSQAAVPAVGILFPQLLQRPARWFCCFHLQGNKVQLKAGSASKCANP